jgi:uncharacterized protein (DUF849 family)
MLQACLNGGRTRDFHAAVPQSPDELAADARAVVARGAQELHIHVRGHDGKESLHPDDVAQTLAAVRASVPGVPVGLSTGWWIPPKGRARQEHIRGWTTLPDYVSINLIEEDSSEVIALALSKGIGIEAGLWSVADAEKFIADPNAGACLRVLIEINEEDFAAGMAAAEGIIDVLDRAGIHLPRLLHGRDATMWPFFRKAMWLGLDGRIGLEDGKHLPNGREVDNATLIFAARALGG